MTENVSYESGAPDFPYILPCSAKRPCYCYGKICLRGGKCSSGNVYMEGHPILNRLWTKTEDIAKRNSLIICNHLGFRNVKETTEGGLVYQSKYQATIYIIRIAFAARYLKHINFIYICRFEDGSVTTSNGWLQVSGCGSGNDARIEDCHLETYDTEYYTTSQAPMYGNEKQYAVGVICTN